MYKDKEEKLATRKVFVLKTLFQNCSYFAMKRDKNFPKLQLKTIVSLCILEENIKILIESH